MNPGKPSRTALVVAQSQALVGRSPATRELVTPAALHFVETALQVSGNRRFAASLRHPWFRSMVRLHEHLTRSNLLHQR